jgi:hypothetical protein
MALQALQGSRFDSLTIIMSSFCFTEEEDKEGESDGGWRVAASETSSAVGSQGGELRSVKAIGAVPYKGNPQ